MCIAAFHMAVKCISFDLSSNYIAAGSISGVIRIYHCSTGKLQMNLSGHIAAVTCLAYRDETTLFSSAKDGSLRGNCVQY
jgi:WD40 repeat protein